jgi:FtsH-binding integral membrane protein
MLKLIRRFLVIAELMFWQGGFMFYAAVVVPVGAAVLRSHLAQGVVTRQVTNWMNLAGVVAVAVFGWDTMACADATHWRRRLRWAAFGVMLVALVLLFWLHVHLDDMFDEEQRRVLDQPTFYRGHQAYLAVSSIQWFAAMMGLFLSLWAWRAEDGEKKANA